MSAAPAAGGAAAAVEAPKEVEKVVSFSHLFINNAMSCRQPSWVVIAIIRKARPIHLSIFSDSLCPVVVIIPYVSRCCCPVGLRSHGRSVMYSFLYKNGWRIRRSQIGFILITCSISAWTCFAGGAKGRKRWRHGFELVRLELSCRYRGMLSMPILRVFVRGSLIYRISIFTTSSCSCNYSNDVMLNCWDFLIVSRLLW